MNKSQLIDAIASRSDLSKSQATAALEGVVKSITDALKREEQVTIVGFGTFMVRQRNARVGRNPRTGETINIAASKVPAFKAGKGLKEAIS